jgi:succinoglycan biosynthesis transport protein ExoP
MRENHAITNREVVLDGWTPEAVRPGTATEGLELYSSLQSYKDILAKYRWLILAVTVAVTALVAVHSVITEPVYRATARILVEADNPELRTMEDLFRSGSPNDDNFLATQVNVLQSDNLAKRTIEQLQLPQIPEFSKYARHHNGNSSSPVVAELIQAFKERLIIERKLATRVIEVSFDSNDPQLAANVVNNLVNNYIEYNFQLKHEAARQTTSWMQQQLDELRNKVEQSQRALIDYERRNSIADVGEKESIAQQKLSDLNRDLTQAQNDRIEKEAFFKLASTESPEQATDLAFIGANDLLLKLQERDANLRQQYSDELAQYGERFPKVVRLRGQIDELQTLIQKARHQIIQRLSNDFEASKAREALLTTALTNQKAEVGDFSQRLIQHNILKRDFESNQQLYENLLQRLKDATVSAGLRATNIHLMDEAVPTAVPVRPRHVRNISFGLLAGLILGFLAAMLRETVDNSVRGAQEVERLIAAPALALIPAQNWLRPGAYGRYRSNGEAKKGSLPMGLSSPNKRRWFRNGNERIELSVLQNPNSPISESFRALRTSILFSRAKPAPHVLLITSSQPMEGKTFVSLNLAFALAQKGNRVLIVDGDLRRPVIASLLRLADDVGLTDVLRGTLTLEECTLRLDTLKNLAVLPAGRLPSNPTEWLSSPSMEAMLWAARRQFEHVIIDSPPVLPVTDATILSRLVDGVVIVVENERTNRAAFVRAYRTITNSGGRIVGAVLNKVDVGRYGSYGDY